MLHVDDDLAELPGHIAAWAARGQAKHLSRVMVVGEAGSTQDLAKHRAEPGLVIVASRQSAGRGRLGRAWSDGAGLGLAMTLTLDAGKLDSARLSIGTGVGTARAIAAFLPDAEIARIGLRWPNDVVERATTGRKLAGVLIERSGELALVGVGINVRQRAEDWPRELRGRAVSIAELGGTASRAEVAERAIQEIDAAMSEAMGSLVSAWRDLDVLIGSVRTFVCDGRSFTGEVETIDPASELVVRTASGERVRLSALTTSLVHD